MPIPNPRPEENESEFVGRCVSEISNEYDQDQAVAICFNTYRESKAQALKRAEAEVKAFIKNESFSDYPDGVKNNAKRGIELNEKVNNKCATQVGKVRAQQLANGEKITVETIKRMYSYLSRAEEYYDETDTKACGTISYLLWGGKAGLGWSRNKLRELGLLNE
jgi:hypothetical protein